MKRLRRSPAGPESDSGGAVPGPEPAITGAPAAQADAELVQAARCGDKRAFVEIVARHQAMVCGIALGILGDFAASEDAGQEAFLTAWRKIHELREPERLRWWLGQIARNAALGHRRRQRGHGPIDLAAEMADDAPGPDVALASKEEAEMVRDSLAKLPEAYRLPLILFYREHQSVRAVADAMGLSEDAVKQRLARGREMLREQMAGLVESVLVRTGPTSVFTMAVAVAMGALAAPAAVAGSVFTASASSAGTAASSGGAASMLAAVGVSKPLLLAAALAVGLSVPVGYRLGARNQAAPANTMVTMVESATAAPQEKYQPNFEGSAILAEWRRLHDTYGTNAEAMPNLYRAISQLTDPFRRRAFRAALMAEWVQVDPTNGLKYLEGRPGETSQRHQFLMEWLARDTLAAVDAVRSLGQGGDVIAREMLAAIARRAPEHVASIAASLPWSRSSRDLQVRDAFAIVAEDRLDFARITAERMTGANRDQALTGVALVWGRADLDATIAWAKALPPGADRDEIIRGALQGAAASDPAQTLERVGLVPPGGKQGYHASTTGARVLKEAAAADFDATVRWLALHPGRLGEEDLQGLAGAVAERLNANASGFLAEHAGAGTLAALAPVVREALLSESSGQRAAVWAWLKQHPEEAATSSLGRVMLQSTIALESALDGTTPSPPTSSPEAR